MTAATRTAKTKVCANPECGKVFTRRKGTSDGSWTRTDYCKPACTPSRRCVPSPNARRANTRIDNKPKTSAALVFDKPYGLADDWCSHAACRDDDVEPELFFAVSSDWSGRLDRAKAAEAKAVCASCPSRLPCLETALAERDGHAIRGGLTPAERKTLKPAMTG